MTRAQFRKVMAKFPGVTLDEQSERDAGVLLLDAPQGYRFVDGSHIIVELFENHGGQSWKPEAYKLAAERLQFGLTPCEDKECDVCWTPKSA